jgi:hypothetical protein
LETGQIPLYDASNAKKMIRLLIEPAILNKRNATTCNKYARVAFGLERCVLWLGA